jgi:preprotein translocase subunit SecA
MERLGIEEGEHIESSMVTRAVENAQKKVEAMHFESRKHLLEYDDVANKQRKVIYAFRNDLLNPEFDIASKIEENRVEYVNNLLINCEMFDGMPAEDFDYNKIIVKLKEELNLVVTQEDLLSSDFESLHDKLVEILKTVYERKMSMAAPDQKSEIERILYLQILDNAWREHLYSMDTLKTGIGLRGYNQKDPLVEYKKESYNMFIELTASIKHEIIKVLFTVQLRNKEEEEREKEMLEKIVSKMEAQQENSRTNLEQPSTEKKIARNEPCPCGSGKKYKQCCGISGPKKGLLAGN